MSGSKFSYGDPGSDELRQNIAAARMLGRVCYFLGLSFGVWWWLGGAPPPVGGGALALYWFGYQFDRVAFFESRFERIFLCLREEIRKASK